MITASSTRARGREGGAAPCPRVGLGLVSAGAAAGAVILVGTGVGGVGGAGAAAQTADSSDSCRIQVGGPGAARWRAGSGHAGDGSPKWEQGTETHCESGSGWGCVGVVGSGEEASDSVADRGGRIAGDSDG